MGNWRHSIGFGNRAYITHIIYIMSFVPIKEILYQILGPWKKPSSYFAFHYSLLIIPSRAPKNGELEAVFHIRQQATPLHPYRESAPYFSFLQLALAICFSIIYTFTHFREQGTVMQLNSKKHKHWRLPLHISFAKHMNAFAETRSKAQACLKSASRGTCCLTFLKVSLEWWPVILSGWPLEVPLGSASLTGFGLTPGSAGSWVSPQTPAVLLKNVLPSVREGFCPALLLRVIWLIHPPTLTISFKGAYQAQGEMEMVPWSQSRTSGIAQSWVQVFILLLLACWSWSACIPLEPHFHFYKEMGKEFFKDLLLVRDSWKIHGERPGAQWACWQGLSFLCSPVGGSAIAGKRRKTNPVPSLSLGDRSSTVYDPPLTVALVHRIIEFPFYSIGLLP